MFYPLNNINQSVWIKEHTIFGGFIEQTVKVNIKPSLTHFFQ